MRLSDRVGPMNIPRICPRCDGAVLEDNMEDEYRCVMCGWRPVEIPLDVQQEVQRHIGRAFIARARRSLPRGKPPLTGSERRKRMKEKRPKAS